MSEEGNGNAIRIRKSHPNLYGLVTTSSLVALALGCNFILLQPTFPIFDAPNELWGGIFLALGLAQSVALNVYRRLRLVRALMAMSAGYMLFLALGTTQPFLEGSGSLQLPILYAGMAAVQVWLLVEPFLNPLTAKKGA